MDLKGLFVLALTVAILLAIRSAFDWCLKKVPEALGRARLRSVFKGLESDKTKRQIKAIRNATALYLKSPHDASTLRAVEQIKKISTGPPGTVQWAAASDFLRGYMAPERERISNMLECPRCGAQRYRGDKRPTGRILVTPRCDKCGFHFSLWLPDELPSIIANWRPSRLR
jgi:predicted Zn-ribbon and HTH transcriptional regulator